MTAPRPTDPALAFEVVKLLLQVVWGDGDLSPRERVAVRRTARTLKLREPQLAQVDRWLARQDPLPPPDLTMLRPRAGDVLRLVRAVAAIDGVSADEAEMVQQIREALAAR